MCFSCYIIITMMNYVKLYLLLEIYIPEPGDIIYYAYPSEHKEYTLGTHYTPPRIGSADKDPSKGKVV